MESQYDQASRSGTDRETILQPRPNAVEPVKVCCPKREIASGAPHLSGETNALLRYRLRAADFILLVGFAVFLVRHVAGVIAGEPLDPLLLGMHVFVVLVLTFGLMPLCRSCPVSTVKLRITELITFGLPAACFLLLQHRTTLSDVARSFMPPPMPFWLLLIFTYGMFIPNTWRRAAIVIGGMALAPNLLVVAMTLIYPEVRAAMTGMIVAQYVLTMLVAAIAAIFGTHLINTLRREAFEAKQLGQYRLIDRLGAGGMGEV